MGNRTLEFWFGYGSTYTYLTVMRIEGALHGKGVDLAWKPFNLTVVMREKGFPKGPFIDRPDKLAYMWRDLERRARALALPYRKPVQYPVDSQTTVRVGYLAASEGWCNQFSRRVFQLNFLEGNPIGATGNLESALRDIGKDPESTIRRAHEPDIEEGLEKETRIALERGIFGSPNFLVGDELYWGDDRLEEAISHCSGARVTNAG